MALSTIYRQSNTGAENLFLGKAPNTSVVNTHKQKWADVKRMNVNNLISKYRSMTGELFP